MTEIQDITPIDNQIDHPDLLARHAQVDKLIRGISRAVIAQPTFSLAYPDKNSFRINWTGFYKDLPQRMLADSWARWLQWAARSLPKPVPPPVQLKFHDLSDENLENLRKRGRKFYVSDSDDEEEATGSIKRQRVCFYSVYPTLSEHRLRRSNRNRNWNRNSNLHVAMT
jgi:hypothetical protein